MLRFDFFLALFALLLSATADARPRDCRPNTDLSSYIDNGTYSGNLCGSRDQTAGSCGSSGEEEGFLITAPSDGQLRLTTDGSTFDTILYVREGDCDGVELGCDDDGGAGSQSTLLIDVTAGQVYSVVVEGYGSACGDFDLTMEMIDCSTPGNDLTSYVNNGVFSGNTCGEGDDSSPGCSSGGEEVAYSFVAPIDGILTGHTDGSDFDTVMYLREATCSGTELDCDDDGGSTSGSSRVSAAVRAGVEYWVFVEGYNSGCGDFDLTLEITDGSCAPTDVRAELSCSSDLFGETTSGGSNELSDYTCGSPIAPLTQGNQEAIYTFTPQSTGSVTFLLDGMSNDQDLYVLEDGCSSAYCIEGA
ncbi:MAG: hypothetical protein KC912_19470, partial [Proteobacteria bacterium]|nr:hypothetical protein [Pseudomonadota bacterium]